MDQQRPVVMLLPGGHAADDGEAPAELWRDAVATAALAPSIFNLQPWLFSCGPGTMTVYEDLDALDPGLTPEGPEGEVRERVISCGAALFTAHLALGARGVATTVATVPTRTTVTVVTEDGVPHLAAPVGVVTGTGTCPPEGDTARLAAMIPLRRTHERLYRSHAIAEHDLLLLREATRTHGGDLTVLDSARRHRLAGLLEQVLVERDGVPEPLPPARRGYPALNADPSSPAVRAEELARSTMLVVSTPHDTRADWITAGMSLQALLLAATRRGLVAGFGDRALQTEKVRPQVSAALQLRGVPQAIVRVGRAIQGAAATPRRPLDTVVARRELVLD